jgi:hypothetical protein
LLGFPVASRCDYPLGGWRLQRRGERRQESGGRERGDWRVGGRRRRWWWWWWEVEGDSGAKDLWIDAIRDGRRERRSRRWRRRRSLGDGGRRAVDGLQPPALLVGVLGVRVLMSAVGHVVVEGVAGGEERKGGDGTLSWARSLESPQTVEVVHSFEKR